MKKSMLFKDDIRSFFIDITDYHTGFGPVIDFDWQGDDAVEIKPKDEKMMYNIAFKNMFGEAVESVKKYIERHPDYSITYYDENRCIVCISEGGVVKSAKKMKKSTEALIFCNDRVYLMRADGYPDYVLNDLNDALDHYDERWEALEDQGLERCWDSGRGWIGNVSHYYKIEGQNGYLEEIPKDKARQMMIQLYGEDRYYNSSSKKMKKNIQDDEDLQYEIRHFGTNLGTTWHGVSGASDYSQFFKDDDRVYQFDHDARGRLMDVKDVTDEDFVIQCPTEAYINIKNASAKKSYTPDYHDFRTMLTNMKMTKDNRTVFKR